ncbi:MAG: hypothetical protein ACLQOO_31885 [Terriglobia bacterium]
MTDFPLVVNAEVMLPDQLSRAKAVKQSKSRLRKMMAAQRDMHGGFRVNVDAQVAEHQLVKVLQNLISSSLKSCQMSFQTSLTIAVRTSKRIRNRREHDEAERILRTLVRLLGDPDAAPRIGPPDGYRTIASGPVIPPI